MKISKYCKTVTVKPASYFTIKRWHHEFNTEKRGNNSDKPNGRPKSVSNESNEAAVAKLVKEETHTSVYGKWVQGFLIRLRQFRK